jgi:hypothetical protein
MDPCRRLEFGNTVHLLKKYLLEKGLRLILFRRLYHQPAVVGEEPSFQYKNVKQL